MSILPLAGARGPAHREGMTPTFDGRPAVVTPDNIVSIRNHPDGIEVTYRRPDGGLGRWITGARRLRDDRCDS